MKLVVFSDAHGYREIVDRVLEFNPDADYVICLGDSEMDQEYFLSRDIIHVKGNYPRDPGFVYEHVLKVGPLSIFITHGHKYKVHRSLDKLIKHAVTQSYDITFYGHTHIVDILRLGTSTFINPGSLSNPRSVYPVSYCVVDVEDKDYTVTFKNAMTNETIEVER